MADIVVTDVFVADNTEQDITIIVIVIVRLMLPLVNIIWVK